MLFRVLTIVTLLFILATSCALSQKAPIPPPDFDIMSLVGEWEGEGFFLIPVTGIEVEIEGSGTFIYDSTRQRLRTAMSGSKLFINYSDSGYLQYYPETDSVSWEIWDSWGKHAIYWGVISDGALRADRLYKKKGYRVEAVFPHKDTLDFHLRVRDKDGSEKDKAAFLLWRKKD
ncbi:MAG: hypothetical protein KOO62_06465 [candidate division Zixibacteria bacterium]|nr:hypothetical protein [candidate division Zixibacteria bacterium]